MNRAHIFCGKFCQIRRARLHNSVAQITKFRCKKSSKFSSSPRPPIYDWKLFRNFSYWRLALY